MEKIKTNIPILTLFLFVALFEAASQIKDIPTVRIFDEVYYKYAIKPKESLYSICKRFHVTEAEVLSMNPFIVDGLKEGQTLMIPLKSKDSSVVGNKKTSAVSDTFGKKSSVKNLPRKILPSVDKTPRITVLLPFASATLNANDKYIEFYEGLLLAVDSLKTLGLSFEVQALESGTDAEGINHALLTGKLTETDYCIGGINPQQITLLAKWAKNNQKNLILPFCSSVPEMENNPYLFQINPSHSFLCERMADYTIKRIDKSHIVFLTAPVDKTDPRFQLIPAIKYKLQKKGTSFSEADWNQDPDALAKMMSDNLENNIICPPLTPTETTILLMQLMAVSKANPQKKIALTGYPEWQALNTSTLKRIHELDTYIYSGFYADLQKEHVADFQNQYVRTYGKNLLNSFPKFAMMGYDIAAYFIPRMVFEKSYETDRIVSLVPVQNRFKFEASVPLGGSSNCLFYVVHYLPDFSVEVIPVE